jgi:NTE family protein
MAVVLAGGGARGAYEAGALSVLLPAIEAEHDQLDRTPISFVGTSAGSINAVGFASLIHLGARAASDAVLDLWRQSTYRAVFRMGHGTERPLDTAPLHATLNRLVDWGQLHENVRTGTVAAVAVVATSYSTLGTTVFVERHAAGLAPAPDLARGIEYVRTPLTAQHVVASSANPAAFPPVNLETSPGIGGWYADGGIRLNTPIKPAIDLGVKRVVVVATAPAERPVSPEPTRPPARPGVVGGAALMAYAVLDDRMVEDLQTLKRRNREDSAKNLPDGEGQSDAIPYLFAGPPPADGRPLARLVSEVLAGADVSPRSRHGFVARHARRKLGRYVAADAARGELASHMFFEPEFMEGAIRLGQRDARAGLAPDGSPDWRVRA